MRGHNSRGVKVLVTGGAGYVGSLLVRRLLARKCQVRVLDALWYGDEAIRGLSDDPNFELEIGDFRDPSTVERALRGVGAVVHLGAIVGDPACAISETFTNEVNVEATKTIARLSMAQGIQRFIFASTCSVYGVSNGRLTETSPVNPVSAYASSKIEAERFLLAETANGFAPTALRFGTAYGTSFRQRFDLAINVLVAKAVLDGEFTIFGGDQWRPFIHVDDMAASIAIVLNAPLSMVSRQIYNVGATEHNYQMSSIGQMIETAVPGTRVTTDPMSVDRRNYWVDFSKIHRQLGFLPGRDMRQSIEELASVARKIGTYSLTVHSNYAHLMETLRATDVRGDASPERALESTAAGIRTNQRLVVT